MQYQLLQMARISFAVVGKHFIRIKHIKIFETVQQLNNKIDSKKAPEYGY